MTYLTRTVWIVSVVSLLTDTASEMLYPVMPVYLRSIGFSVVLIGVLEGIAEATAGLSKGFFGSWSDSAGQRVPFVRIGYLLSTLSRPLMAVFIQPVWIFFARTMDRFGKGIRTAPRDAILAAESRPESRARVFGFHRSMDTIGAVAGPALALLYLNFYPGDYRTLFFIAFIPGLLAVLTTLLLREHPLTATNAARTNPFAFLSYWKIAPASYKKLAGGLLFFALFNSSDVFLLLKAKESGLDDRAVIGLYILFNLSYVLSAFPMGILADRMGYKRILLFGLLMFAIVYAGLALLSGIWVTVLFILYGMYWGATEGISRAWIATVAEQRHTATAIGNFAGMQSLCSLVASSLTGVLWVSFGGSITFLVTAAATIGAAIYLIFIPGPEIK
ncbi:MAG: MFS transporter [Bacteroidota bacterium]